MWTADGTRLVGNVPIAVMAEVCDVGPQDRRIRGSLGVFEGYHGWNEHAQFPALWSLNSQVHQGMLAEPNAWLVPKPDRDHGPIWEQSSTLQITRDVRYNSQPIMATVTNVRALGVRAWFTLRMQDADPVVASRQEVAPRPLVQLHTGYVASREPLEQGAGRAAEPANKAMLQSLPTLGRAKSWKRGSWTKPKPSGEDFRNRTFQPFHHCAIDPVRKELDRRIVREMLGLPEAADLGNL